MNLEKITKSPISADSPGGVDPKELPEFEQLEQEIEKMTRVTATTPVDWNVVIRLSSGILSDKSKDLMTACYLAYGLIESRKLDGLKEGLQVLSGIISNFWETLHPPLKRIRGRRNAIQWYMDKSSQFFSKTEFQPVPQEVVDGIKSEIDALDTVMKAKDSEGPMILRLNELVRNIPVKPPEAPVASGAVSQASAQGAGAGLAQIGAIGTLPEAEKALDIALDNLKKIGEAYYSLDKSSPEGYALTRFAIWHKIVVVPPSKDNKTMIPAPPKQVQDLLKTNVGGAPEAALDFCENQISQYLFWLDPHRHSSQALKSLGGKHKDAAVALEGAVSAFTGRFPEIAQLSFADGTPFADGETAMWLSELGGGKSGGGASLGNGHDANAGKIADILKSAEELAGDGKLADAANSLLSSALAAASARERLLIRINLCKMLVRFQKAQSVVPFVKLILEDIDKHNLDEWEPSLALQGLTVCYQTMKLLTDQFTPQQVKDVFGRISMLDFGTALKLSG